MTDRGGHCSWPLFIEPVRYRGESGGLLHGTSGESAAGLGEARLPKGRPVCPQGPGQILRMGEKTHCILKTTHTTGQPETGLALYQQVMRVLTVAYSAIAYPGHCPSLLMKGARYPLRFCSSEE